MQAGVVGLGVMGRPMAERLLAAGHTVHVYNRTRERAAPLAEAGAIVHDTPADVARTCDVVISVVSDPAAVEAVATGCNGVLAGLGERAVHCDMSTVSPASAGQMAALYAEHGRAFVQAPVLGSRRQIEQGVLMVFGGGRREHVDLCGAAWSAFADRVWNLDTVEQAAALKLACNAMIATTILGLGQSLLLAASGGVDPSVTLEVLGASATRSRVWTWARMCAGWPNAWRRSRASGSARRAR